MNDQDNRKLLEKLESEIEQAKPTDEKGRELLRHLKEDIRTYRERSGDDQGQPEDSFIENLNDAVEHFEITHPRLTMMLSQILNTLSNAGI
jgi:Domain of unknown function (DUF4404)